jgi:protocatechuate 3,4-dioxygenase beta subunit
VLDKRGAPVRGATVEIWQCDANGVYNHPRQPGLQRRDADFQGYGRTEVAADGGYSFRTIRPVAYPGRTPHIHFKVNAPGLGRLTTQMYVAGEPGNARDGVLNAIRNAAQRASVIVRLEPAGAAEPGALLGVFDIVLNT